MKLTTEDKSVIQDFVWSNRSHKDKKVAATAAIIRFSSKLDAGKDASALCELMRLPRSFGKDIHHALEVAEKLRELKAATKNKS